MKNICLKGIASFMIAIILTIPIYSSSVMATLSNARLYGSDQINGILTREDYTVFIEATARIPGDSEISPSQLHIIDRSGSEFHSCNATGNGYFNCYFMMGARGIAQNPFQIPIVLYKDDGRQDSSITLEGVFDELPPEITTFTITPQYTRGGSITIDYAVYDHSYSPTDRDRCSSIQKIELSSPDKGIFRTEEINWVIGMCDRSGRITVSVNNVTNSYGQIPITLTVYDILGQSASLVRNFNYDIEGPLINLDSLQIKNTAGNDIEFVTTSTTPGNVIFTITADDLRANSVFADISEINIENPSGYRNKQAICTLTTSSDYRCTIDNVQIKLSQSTNVHIIVNASDLAGNVASETLIKAITVDTSGPTVTSIRTEKVDDGISYVGNSNTFVAVLNEDGIGLDKNNIKLDLSNIKTGMNNKAADNCTNSGNTWTCYWFNIPSDKGDGEKTISVVPSSSDKLGNLVGGTLSALVTVDRTNPVIVSSSVIGRGVGAEAFPGYIKTGDIMDIRINAREPNKLRAYADISSFITNQNNVPGSCSKTGNDNWTCSWQSSQINVPGHIIGNINFNVSDVVGNKVIHQKQVEVMEYEGASNVSYWTSQVACSPSLVDRQITNLVSTKVYCSVTLSPTTPNQETLSINLGSCSSRFNNSLGYIENINLLNAQRGSTEPYIAINLIKGEMIIDKLSITCPLQIISRAGTKINQNPEIEPVQIDINFYNMPLGEFGQGIEEKIEDAKDEALKGIWGVIGFLKTILKYASLICNILAMIQKIKLILNIFTGDITAAHLASVGTPVEPIIAATKYSACNLEDALGETAKQKYVIGEGLCKFVNCQMSPPESDNAKITSGKGIWGNIATSITSGAWFGDYNKFMDLPMVTPGTGVEGNRFATGTISEVVGKQYSQYANARDNLMVAVVTGCIPGIINGLDKYRQILCMYADCLEQNAYNNVPVKVCDDQKSYATCKYITGEIFALLPYTALFDYYVNMVRGALSDPLSAVGIVLSFACKPVCTPDAQGSLRWQYTERTCRAVAFLSMLGEIIGDITGIIDGFNQVKTDYCSRLQEDDKEED